MGGCFRERWKNTLRAFGAKIFSPTLGTTDPPQAKSEKSYLLMNPNPLPPQMTPPALTLVFSLNCNGRHRQSKPIWPVFEMPKFLQFIVVYRTGESKMRAMRTEDGWGWKLPGVSGGETSGAKRRLGIRASQNENWSHQLGLVWFPNPPNSKTRWFQNWRITFWPKKTKTGANGVCASGSGGAKI